MAAMKYLILLGDGMGDQPIDQLGGRTPLQAAKIRHMNELSKQGLLGLVKTTPDGMEPLSDVTHLSIMGYDPRTQSVARAPIEASSLGIAMEPADVAFRCNLVTFRQEPSGSSAGGEYDFAKLGPGGILEDYSAGHISTQDARELIQDLNNQIGTESIQFYPGLSYRHLMIWIGGRVRARCTPPQDMMGQKAFDYLPTGEGEKLLREVIKSAVEILSAHPINEARREEGLKPANGVWLWGQGKSFELPSFRKRFGVSGAIVAAVELAKGLGAAVGWEVIQVPGATGYLDTDYAAKAGAALEALERVDLAMVHVEAPDEASHEGNLEAKMRAIEEFDGKLVGTVMNSLDRFDELRILLLCDHLCPVMLRRHTTDPVPFVIFEKSKRRKIRGSGLNYHESDAASTGRVVAEGTKLMPFFLKG